MCTRGFGRRLLERSTPLKVVSSTFLPRLRGDPRRNVLYTHSSSKLQVFVRQQGPSSWQYEAMEARLSILGAYHGVGHLRYREIDERERWRSHRNVILGPCNHACTYSSEKSIAFTDPSPVLGNGPFYCCLLRQGRVLFGSVQIPSITACSLHLPRIVHKAVRPTYYCLAATLLFCTSRPTRQPHCASPSQVDSVIYSLY